MMYAAIAARPCRPLSSIRKNGTVLTGPATGKYLKVLHIGLRELILLSVTTNRMNKAPLLQRADSPVAKRFSPCR
ncbi:hypothetical protein NDU88_008486 [Pleurodeles waltl]|uniref:Uncharacterized protein n=1 Tax=Pleurodeles waltl TaxID=8319 RepID=A0AAV7PWS8_PLEWA|nr:hypothetical protein NDU88_008486 [Pleurodeles waltl]